MAIKKVQIIPPNYTDIIHPETQADITKYNNSNSELVATNVQSAIDEIDTKTEENKTDILTLETQNGVEILTTTAQTLSGAINEHEAQINSLDVQVDTHKAEKATQNKLGHVKVDEKTIFINEDGEISVNNPYPHDFSGSPGSEFLIAGDMFAGFFGEVLASEFITGDDLAILVGISAGTSQFSNEPWLKFAYQGNVQFVAKKPFRHSLSWDTLNSANCVYGDKTIQIGELTYKVRLIRGALTDPCKDNDVDRGTQGSEWNRLMLPIHVKAKDKSWDRPNYVEADVPYWGIDYIDTDLHVASGNGSATWCQETALSNLSNRIYRGQPYIESSYWVASYKTTSYYGWRPVIELVQ